MEIATQKEEKFNNFLSQTLSLSYGYTSDYNFAPFYEISDYTDWGVKCSIVPKNSICGAVFVLLLSSLSGFGNDIEALGFGTYTQLEIIDYERRIVCYRPGDPLPYYSGPFPFYFDDMEFVVTLDIPVPLLMVNRLHPHEQYLNIVRGDVWMLQYLVYRESLPLQIYYRLIAGQLFRFVPVTLDVDKLKSICLELVRDRSWCGYSETYFDMLVLCWFISCAVARDYLQLDLEWLPGTIRKLIEVARPKVRGKTVYFFVLPLGVEKNIGLNVGSDGKIFRDVVFERNHGYTFFDVYDCGWDRGPFHPDSTYRHFFLDLKTLWRTDKIHCDQSIVNASNLSAFSYPLCVGKRSGARNMYSYVGSMRKTLVPYVFQTFPGVDTHAHLCLSSDPLPFTGNYRLLRNSGFDENIYGGKLSSQLPWIVDMESLFSIFVREIGCIAKITGNDSHLDRILDRSLLCPAIMGAISSHVKFAPLLYILETSVEGERGCGGSVEFNFGNDPHNNSRRCEEVDDAYQDTYFPPVTRQILESLVKGVQRRYVLLMREKVTGGHIIQISFDKIKRWLSSLSQIMGDFNDMYDRPSTTVPIVDLTESFVLTDGKYCCMGSLCNKKPQHNAVSFRLIRHSQVPIVGQVVGGETNLFRLNSQSSVYDSYIAEYPCFKRGEDNEDDIWKNDFKRRMMKFSFDKYYVNDK